MKILLSFILLLAVFWGYGQIDVTDKANINWGPKIPQEKRASFVDIISHDETGYYMLKNVKNGMALEKYNLDLSQADKFQLPLKYQGDNLFFEGITEFNDKFLLLSSHTDRKLKKNSLFYQVIDKKNLSAEGEATKVGEIGYEKKRFQGEFDYEISLDSTKLLLFFSKPYLKDAPEQFGFKVMNQKLEELWNKEVTLPYKQQLFTVKDYRVSNNGDVYILGKEFSEDKTNVKKKGTRKYKYHIVGYFDNGTRIKDFEVDLEDKFISEITFRVRNNGDIICAGFYSENGSYGIKGTFFLAIDGETKKIKSSNLKEFEENFITQNWTQKQIDKAKRKEAKKDRKIEMYNYDLRNFILRDDGGVVLLAEQYYVYVTTHTYTDANGYTRTTTTYHYNYNDIIVVNVAPDGNIDWTTKIEKTQHSTNDGGRLSSYALQVKDDQMYLVYNESAKRYFDKEELKKLEKKEKKAYLTLLVSIANNGEYNKEILFNNSNDRIYTVPKLCEQISDDQMIIYSVSRKGQKFGNMRLK